VRTFMPSSACREPHVGLNVDADALRKFCMTKPQVLEKAETFAQFWRHYLRDHAQAGTRVLHFVGTGLGTSIVEALARQLNATVEKSGGPQGTTVSIVAGAGQGGSRGQRQRTSGPT